MRDLDELRDVVAGAIVDRAVEVSGCLDDLGVPHALIGGIAVGLHGHVRATRDVDFLVGKEAFERTHPLLVFREELGELVRIGHTDLMSVPPAFPGLEEELSLGEPIPVISLPALILLKLDAFRPRDREDVRQLLTGQPGDVREVRDYLVSHAPHLVPRLAEALTGR